LNFDPNFFSVRDDVGVGIKATNKIDKGYGTLNEKNEFQLGSVVLSEITKEGSAMMMDYKL
jgi:hypothetical protein